MTRLLWEEFWEWIEKEHTNECDNIISIFPDLQSLSLVDYDINPDIFKNFLDNQYLILTALRLDEFMDMLHIGS